MTLANPPAWRRVLDGIAMLAALALLSVFVIDATVAIVAHGWRDIVADQWRQYVPLLEQPFPANVLVAENGHRFIFPNLLTLVDIHALQANQAALLAGSLVTSLALVGMIAWAAKRTPVQADSQRAAMALLGAAAVLWLANARMLVHGNDAFQVHLTALAFMAGAWCTWRAAGGRGLRWIVLAFACCVVATFSFGAGMASFPALLVLALLLRVRRAAVITFAVAFLAMAVAYAFLLPGNDGVRESVALAPLDSLAMSLRWLGNPWMHAGLGTPEPGFVSWLSGSLPEQGDTGKLIATSANGLASVFGGPAFVWWGSVVLGACGAGWLLVELVLRARRARETSAIEALGLGLAIFAGGVALIIGLVRLRAFEAVPMQVFAERYLVWSCLFWLGLSLMACGRLASRPRPVTVTFVPVLLAIAVAWLLMPTQSAWRGWTRAASSGIERAALAWRLGLFVPELRPNRDEAWPEVVDKMAALAKARSLGPFRTPVPPLGDVIPAPSASARDGSVQVPRLEPYRDPRDDRAWLRYELVLRRPANAREPLLLDATGSVVGAARWAYGSTPPGHWPPQWQDHAGYHAYALARADCAPLRLLDRDGGAAWRVIAIVPTCRD